MCGFILKGKIMKYRFLKLICFLYFLSGARLFALGPVTSMSSNSLDSVEGTVSQAVATFRQTCVGTSGQYSIMPEITMGQVVVTTVTTEIAPVRFSGGDWTWVWGTGWTGLGSNPSVSATNVTVHAPDESNVSLGQAYVAAIILHINLEEGATACPTTVSACTSAATTLNTAITTAWSGILTIPNVTPTIDCTATGTGPAGAAAASTTTYAPVTLPTAASVNVNGVRDYLWY
jgi:hypothetical protein